MGHRFFLCFLAMAWLGILGCEVGLRGDTYFGKDFAFRIAPPPAGWRPVEATHAALAYRDDAKEATVLVNGRCGMDGEDIPLSALTQHLFLRFTERQPEQERIVPFDGREALHTVLVAKLDGVPMKFDAWVLKKDGCVYDFILMTPPARFAEAEPEFERFVRSFTTVGGRAR